MAKLTHHGSRHFMFELPQHSPTGIYLHTLTVEGWGCKKDGYIDADIDKVYLHNEDVKPLLEINGGMILIDQAATEYVRSMYRTKLRKVA